MQGTICQDFGNVKKNEMIKYLKVLTLYRNVCAHNERLFSYHTYIDIPDTLLHKKLGISKNGSKYIYGKNDLFSVVITFRYLLPKTDFLLFKKQLLHIFDRYEKQNSNLKLIHPITQNHNRLIIYIDICTPPFRPPITSLPFRSLH